MASTEFVKREAVRLHEEVWKDMSLHEVNYEKMIRMQNSALETEPYNISTLTNLGAALCDTGKH